MTMSFSASTTAAYNPNPERNATIESDDGGPLKPPFVALLPDEGDPSQPRFDGNGPAFVTSDGASPADGDVAITAAGAEPPVSNDIEGEAEEELLCYDCPLVGPTWSLVKYFSPTSNDLVDVPEGSFITLEFEGNGSFKGHAGCNDCSDGYTDLTVDSLSTFSDPLVTTRIFCGEEVNRKEFAHLQSFEGDIDWSISEDGSGLELTAADDGNVLAQYSLYTPPIIGPTWEATKIYDASSGALVDVVEGSTITFIMENNGRFNGSAGYNNYNGTHANLTSTSFVINGPVGSTGMLCELEEINEQEVAYLSNFDYGCRIGWAIMDDGSLELKNAYTGDVFATYKAALGASAGPMSFSKQDSAAVTFETAITAYTMVAVMVPVWIPPCISFS